MDTHELFRACMTGDSTIIKQTYDSKTCIENVIYMFVQACKNGHMNVVQYLYDMSNIEKHLHFNHEFVKACKRGYIDLARWFEDKIRPRKVNCGRQPCREPESWISTTRLAFVQACGKNQLHVCEWLVQNCGYDTIYVPNDSQKINNYVDCTALSLACTNGHIRVIEWLLQTWPQMNVCEHDNLAYTRAYANGQHHVVIWLIENVPYLDVEPEKVILTGFRIGNEMMIDYILDNIPNIDVRCKDDAIIKACCKGGYLDLAKKIVAKYPSIDITCAFKKACKHDNTHILDWLYETYDCQCPDMQTMTYAIKHCHSTAYWLAKHYPAIKRGYDTWNRKRIIVDICKKGNLDMLKWSVQYLSNSRFPGCGDLFYAACRVNNVDMIKWICERFQNIGEDYADTFVYGFVEACRYGHINVAKWLLAKYPIDVYSFDHMIFKAACASNNIHLANWLITKYPDIDASGMNELIFTNACRDGYTQIVKFILDCFPDTNIYARNADGFLTACAHGYLDIVVIITEYYPDIKEYIIKGHPLVPACRKNQIHVVKWLVEKYPEIDIHADNCAFFREISQNNNIELIEYMYDITRNSHDTYYFGLNTFHIVSCKMMNMDYWICHRYNNQYIYTCEFDKNIDSVESMMCYMDLRQKN